jgi:type VI secretion system protein ImpC
MPAKLSSASFEFSTTPGQQPKSVPRDSQKRFNMVVMGDFTGRTNRGAAGPLASRKLLHVDCDNSERVFAQLGARLRLPGAAASNASSELEFSSFDDFHPDALLTKVPTLAKIFEARQLLLNPSTADQGKAALQAYLGAAIGVPPEQAQPAGPAKGESDDQTLARLLGGQKPSGPKPGGAPSHVEQFIRQLVAPHVAPTPASWQQSALSAVDIELAKGLRALLHHPDFQSLEAAWRGADFLLRHIEAVEDIGVFLLDVSQSELEAELLGAGDLPHSELARLLRDRNLSLVAANYTFGQTADDVRALGRMADLASSLGAPFIATASPRLVGCDSFGLRPDPDDWKIALRPEVETAWQALRKTPAANHLGLAAPRFLLRQPYGKSSDAIESFLFEELAGEGAHECFLWGHPAILCACVIADAFQTQVADEQTDVEAPGCGEVGDLPVHKYLEDGETVIKPYAEAWLTERAADRIVAGGIMPLLSRKDYNSIRLPSLHSVALPAGTLPLRWSRRK